VTRIAGRPLTSNELAAVLAFWAGLVFVAIGWNGTRIVGGFLLLLEDLLPGQNPSLRIASAVLGWISPLSGAFVIAGAILILTDRVRLGKVVVLFGTGVGVLSLVLFALLLVRRPGTLGAHEGVLPALLGVVLSLAARLWARAPEPRPAP
jgi:hypothetical protein